MTFDAFMLLFAVAGVVGFPLWIIHASNKARPLTLENLPRPPGTKLPTPDEWAATARALGLVTVTPQFLQGTRGGRDVILSGQVGLRPNGTPYSLVDIRVRLPAVAQRLTLDREGPFGGNDVATGDRAFDARLDLGSERHVPLALFNARVREGLRQWTGKGLAVSAGWISLALDRSLPDAIRILDELVELAGAMDIADEPSALASMAASDPVPGVRARALERLGAAHRSAPATRSAARTALRDSDAGVRATALDVLHSADAGTDVRESLEALLSDPDDTVRRKALAFIEPPVDGGLFDLVLACADSGKPALQSAAAEALGRLGDPRGEDMLVALLGSDTDDTKAAAARALALVGTLTSVEPLLAQAGRFTNAGEAKEAARDAVRRIQSRAGTADAGRLSIAEAAGESGALSVATEGGALSVAPDRKERDRG